MVSPGGVEAGGGQKVRWRTSQSSTSTSQSKTTARELQQTSLNILARIIENISRRNILRKGKIERKLIFSVEKIIRWKKKKYFSSKY